MSNLHAFFKPKKTNAIEEAFLKQCELVEKEKIESNAQSKCDEQIIILENVIKTLKTEKEDIHSKYENLKKKHTQLLQVLLKLEVKNEELSLKQHKEPEAACALVELDKFVGLS